jgi:hypothetical protein
MKPCSLPEFNPLRTSLYILFIKITFVDIGIPDRALKVIGLKEVLAFYFFFQNNHK